MDCGSVWWASHRWCPSSCGPWLWKYLFNNIKLVTIKTQNKLKYLGSMNDRSKIAYPWEGLETPDYKRSRRTVDITIIIKLVTIKTQKKLKYFGFTDDVWGIFVENWKKLKPERGRGDPCQCRQIKLSFLKKPYYVGTSQSNMINGISRRMNEQQLRDWGNLNPSNTQVALSPHSSLQVNLRLICIGFAKEFFLWLCWPLWSFAPFWVW